jgi:Mycothiol maleylpyruvate isomerase N-terminal domain
MPSSPIPAARCHYLLDLLPRSRPAGDRHRRQDRPRREEQGREGAAPGRSTGAGLTPGNVAGFMASFEFLDRTANGFERRLRLVTDAQRTLPTPCPEFNVHDLVTHQIRGMRIHTSLLQGATGAQNASRIVRYALLNAPIQSSEPGADTLRCTPTARDSGGITGSRAARGIRRTTGTIGARLRASLWRARQAARPSTAVSRVADPEFR